MTKLQPYAWRKGIVLSATFFIAVFATVSCRKTSSLGESTLADNNILSSEGVDTFSLITYSYYDDSIITDNPVYELLGSYNDPLFGTMNAEIYTEFQLSAFSPVFDMDSIVVDSFVLVLSYRGLYGDISDHYMEVFEITETGGLDTETNYYAHSTVQTAGTDLVMPGQNVHELSDAGQSIVGDDTLDNKQLRIPLDTTMCRNMMINAGTNPENWQSDEAFQEYFKGLHIKTTGGGWVPGTGGVAYFNLNDPASQLIMYYREGNTPKEFELRISSECTDFNHVDIDSTNTEVEFILADSTRGQKEFFAQAFGVRGVIAVPGLSNIPKNAVIHKATLELPVQYQTGSKYSPGTGLSTATWLTDTSKTLANLGQIAQYSNFSKSFEVNLRQYVQLVVNGELENTGIVVAPIFYISSAERVVFNGIDTDKKVKPKFRILYTEF